MPELKTEFYFQTTFDQKEFSLVTRALAGHVLQPTDKLLAEALNQRLLELRMKQLKTYSLQSARALEVAIEEATANVGFDAKVFTPDQRGFCILCKQLERKHSNGSKQLCPGQGKV